MGTLVRITAPHFCAGLEAEGGRVVRTAPILRYMTGWDGRQVAGYCARKHWTCERVCTYPISPIDASSSSESSAPLSSANR